MSTTKPDFLAPSTIDEPEAMRTARSFFEGTAPAPSNLPVELGAALVDALVAARKVEQLSGLALVTDKGLAKQARRGIHLLRSQGVAAVIPHAVVPAAPHEAPVEIFSLATSPMRDGEMLVWYVQQAVDDPRLDLFQAQITERAGLQSFEMYRATKKQWRDMEKSIVQETRLPLVRIPRRWARWLLEEAYERSVAIGRSLPRGFMDARLSMGEPERYPEHPALAALGPAGDQSNQSDLARAILLPETSSWIPDEEAALRAIREVQALAQSPLLLDERVKIERIGDLLHREVAAELAAGWGGRLARRFLDAAWFVLRLRDQARTDVATLRDYAADARLLVRASQSVADRSVPSNDNVIAQAIFARILEAATSAPPTPAELQEKTTSAGIILPP